MKVATLAVAAAALASSASASNINYLRRLDDACSSYSRADVCNSDNSCVWLKPIRRKGKIITPGNCVTKPASCAAAGGNKRVCMAVDPATAVCIMKDDTCVEVSTCDMATVEKKCDAADDLGGSCTWLSRKVGKKKKRRTVSSCVSTPETCEAAGTDANLCRIAKPNCAINDDGNCAEVTSCAEASSTAVCEGVDPDIEECVWLAAKRNKRNKVIRQAECANVPATCTAADSSDLCTVAFNYGAGNCAWADGACGDVETCAEAKNPLLCAGVSGEACTWDTKSKQCKVVTVAPTLAPTSAPTAAPTSTPCKPADYARCNGIFVCKNKNSANKRFCSTTIEGCTNKGGLKYLNCHEE